jgi:hypothetical protein
MLTLNGCAHLRVWRADVDRPGVQQVLEGQHSVAGFTSHSQRAFGLTATHEYLHNSIF